MTILVVSKDRVTVGQGQTDVCFYFIEFWIIILFLEKIGAVLEVE